MIANFLKDKQLQYDILTRKKRMLKENGMWEEMFDRDQNDLFIECCSVTGENFTEKLFETVLNSSVIPAVNPLRLYLSSLEEWSDGMPDYMWWLTLIVFLIAGFIQAYVWLTLLGPVYLMRGSIAQQEKERENILTKQTEKEYEQNLIYRP